MEHPALAHHRDLLSTESLSASPSPEEAATRWRRYVNDEVERMLAAQVNPRFRDSWMLRKGVRAQLPLATLQRMYAPTKGASEWPNHRDNKSEAVRYALVDGTLSNDMLALFSRASGGFEPDLWLLAFAALARNWDVALAIANAILRVNAGRYETAVMTLDRLGFPRGRNAEFDAAAAAIPAPRRNARVASLFEEIQIGIPLVDDADNYLSIDGFDLRRSGIIIDRALMATAPLMSAWVGGEAGVEGDSYVASLGEVLSERFADHRVVGSGAYGIVITASRGGRRWAIKLTRLADPLGKTTVADRRLVESELRINLLLAHFVALRHDMPFFPWVDDWTRGRMDIVRTLEILSGSRQAANRLLVPGPGVYLAQVMPAFDFTLEAWLAAAVRASGSDAAAHNVFARMIVAIIAVLMIQLATFRYNFVGFKHTDIKTNNVLLHQMGAGDDPSKPVIRLAYSLRGTPISVRVLHTDTGSYAPSLSDVGLASIQYPPVGETWRTNTDLQALAAMIPIDWPGEAGITLAHVRDSLIGTVDDGTPATIFAVFAKWQRETHGAHLNRFIEPRP